MQVYAASLDVNFLLIPVVYVFFDLASVHG